MEGNCLGLWGLVVSLTFVLYLPVEVTSHGRMIEPPMRSSMWRFGFNTPRNYDDNGLNCGGFENQHHFQDGKCGVCGDPWQGPKRNEPNGIYATGTITRRYRTGQKIPLVLDITSNHKGYFEFRICPWNNPRLAVNQSCLDENPLVVEGSVVRYPLTLQGAFVMVNLTGQLPDNLTCTQCVLQWRWVGGQHMGIKDGRECMGCGKQEQWHNCADVAIGYDYPLFEMTKPGIIQETVPPPTVATSTTVQPIVPGGQEVKTNVVKVKDFSRQSGGRLGAPTPVEITAAAYNNMNIGMPSRKVSRFEPEKKPAVTIPPDKGPLITYLADTPPPPQPLIISSSDLFFKKPAEPDVGVREAQVTAQQEDPNLSRGVSFTSLLERNTDTQSSVPNVFGHVQANEGTSQFMKVSLQSLTGNPTKHVNSFTGKSFPSRFGSYPYRMYNSRDKTPSVLISSQSSSLRFSHKQPPPISTVSRTNQNGAIQTHVPVDLSKPIIPIITRKEQPKVPSTETPITTYPTTSSSSTTMTTTTTITTTTTTSPTTTTTPISTTVLSTSTGTFSTSRTKRTTITATTTTATTTTTTTEIPTTVRPTTEIPTTEIPTTTTTTTAQTTTTQIPTITTQIPPAVPITQGYIIQDTPLVSTFGPNFVPYVTNYYPTELYYITNDMTPNAPPGEYLATTPDPSLTMSLYAADVPTESRPPQQADPAARAPDANASATTSSPKSISRSGVKPNSNPRFVPSNTIVDPNQPWMTHQDYLASMSSQTSNVANTFHPYQIAVVNGQVVVPPGMTQAQARAQAQTMLQSQVQKRLQAQANAQTRTQVQIQTQSHPQPMMVNQQRMMAMQASAINGGPANFNMMTQGPRSSTFNTQSTNRNYPMWGQQLLPRELEGIPGPMCATGQSICRGKGVWANMQNFDRYCATQCMMGLCPFNLCVCTCPGEEFIRQDCRSWIDTNHMNRWCEQNCLGGFCPAEICYCNI